MKNQILIIGGGIVGLATGYQLLKIHPHLKLKIIEKEPHISKHQTSHNSGVIHSGLYYKPGSLKAQNCLEGYRQLLAFCDAESIPYELCGKIVVATTSNELPWLKTLYERGSQNGLSNLKYLEREALKDHEPNVQGLKGLFVPQTGIIDYKIVANKYAEKIMEMGGEIRLNETALKIEENRSGCSVITNQSSHDANLVVNCAGLYSDKMSKFTHKNLNLKIIPFRGEYFKLKKEKENLVNNLIYPVPNPSFPFLGVHFTRMIQGGVEAGPNAVLAFRREGYKKTDINIKEFMESITWPGFQKVAIKYWKTGMGEMYRSFSKSAFTMALQKLIPAVQKNDLVSGGAGVRAQACLRNGELLDDFLILESAGAINVCNAPSPGATASLAIGKHIANLVIKRF